MSFSDLFHRVSDLERRVANTVRHGTVHEVNAGEGWVRIDLGDGDDGKHLSAKIPYAQMAGGLKLHSPPTVGQQMTMISPGGDAAQAVAMPLTWSESTASPSDQGDEHVLTFGSARIELRGNELVVTMGGFTLNISSSAATFSVGGVSHVISGGGVETSGGMLKHDGKNVGSSHIHGGVTFGPTNTDVPAN